MTAIQLKLKYPELWDQVYTDTIEDLKLCLTQAQISQHEDGNPKNILTRIAHNAAFSACYANYMINKRALTALKKL